MTNPALPTQIFHFDNIEVDTVRGRLTVDGEERHLRQKTFQVLVHLIVHRERLISKAELFENIWRDVSVTDDVLVQCVTEIRRVLNDDRSKQRFIKTVHKSGYRFVADVNVPDPVPENSALEKETIVSKPSRSLTLRIALAAIILLIATSSALYLVLPLRQPPPEVRLPVIEGRKSIAVMFFDNRSKNPEFEWLREGLADMLIACLSRSEGLTVLSREQMFALVERHFGRKEILSIEQARDLATKSSAAYFTTGGFSQIGGSTRLDVRLYKTESADLIASESLTVEKPEHLLTQIDILALKISSKLDAAPEQKNGAMHVMTDDLEAYRFYSLGVEKALALHKLEGIELFEKAIKLDPDFAMAQARIGYTYAVSSGETEKGKPYLEKAFQLGSRLTDKDRLSITAWYAIANLDFPAAIRSYRELIERFPLETESYSRLARLLRGEDKADEAIDVLRRGLAVDPDDMDMHNALGTILSGEGRHDEAIIEHELYVALASDEPNAYDSLGLSYQAAGNYAKAVENYQKAIALNSKFEIAVIHLANTQYRLGQYDAAIQSYKRYVALATSKLEQRRGYEGIVQVYIDKDNLPFADRFDSQVERLQVEPSWTRYLLLKKHGQVARAKSLSAQLIAKLPSPERGARSNKRFELYYRGIVAFDNGLHDEALDHFRQVIAFPPPSWHWTDFEDCLAMALLEMGRYDDAIGEFRRILATNAHFPRANFYLGKAFEGKGDLTTAREHYLRFMELWKDADPDIPEVKAAKAALE